MRETLQNDIEFMAIGKSNWHFVLLKEGVIQQPCHWNSLIHIREWSQNSWKISKHCTLFFLLLLQSFRESWLLKFSTNKSTSWFKSNPVPLWCRLIKLLLGLKVFPLCRYFYFFRVPFANSSFETFIAFFFCCAIFIASDCRMKMFFFFMLIFLEKCRQQIFVVFL